MKVTYSWIIFPCLIFGTGILCNSKHERRLAVSSRSKNTDDKFNCSNGESIEWPLLCDGYDDCSDGSDETKELCALYEFETNMSMDCGRVHNMKDQVTPKETNQSIIELAPWTVAVYEKNAESKFEFIQPASIIAPNIVISIGFYFWDICKTYEPTDVSKLNLFKIGPMTPMVNSLEDYKLLINVTMIYSTADNITRAGNEAEKTIAVIVLANKLPLSNGFALICIDWSNKYDVRKKTQMRIIGWNHNGDNKEVKVIQYFTYYRTAADEIVACTQLTEIVGWGKTEKGIYSPVLLEASLPYIDQSTCRKMYTNGFELYVTKDKFCAGSELGQGVHEGDSGAGLSFLHSNLYYLIGVASVKDPYTNNSIAVFTEVKHHIQWIRRLYDEHH